jgi:outer membrane protein
MGNNMKSLLLISVCLLAAVAPVAAQKFAYVDSKYILSHMPEYQAAQNEINKLSEQWQKDIEEKYATIEKLEKAYQAEKILLTEEMKRKREEEINQKRIDAKDMQKRKFGVDGELFKKREELIKPIQDQIYQAIQELSSQSSIMVVFDRANHSNILYSNPKHDISDKVLKKMGLKPGEIVDDDEDEAPKETGGKPGGTAAGALPTTPSGKGIGDRSPINR